MDQRCVWLALDGQKTAEDARATLNAVMAGPMSPYVRGFKANDLLHCPPSGPVIVGEILRDYPELAGFLDLKLKDVRDTDLNILRRYEGIGWERLYVTVSVHSDVEVFIELQEQFPGLQVITFGVGTDIAKDSFERRYGMSPSEAMQKWFGGLTDEYRRETGNADAHPSPYVIASYDMLEMMAESFPGVKSSCPGVRDEWMLKGGQKRTSDTLDFLRAGAEVMVMGAQLIRGNPDNGVSANESRKRTAELIKQYFASLTPRVASSASQLVPIRLGAEAVLSLLRQCGGYYICPTDPENGLPLGPLVAYSGHYDAPDGSSKQFLGKLYYNFAQTEEFPHVTDLYARGMAPLVRAAFPGLNRIVGVPKGGHIIGQNLARVLDRCYSGLEEKVLEMATATSKERKQLVLGRHDVRPGDEVALAEDLCNNYSTTDPAIAVVEATGARVIGITCILNRSDRTEYKGLPVVALVHLPTPQYTQEDEEVVPYLENPGVVWDVKPNWTQLEEVMRQAETRGISVY